jgi:hypothetical protein
MHLRQTTGGGGHHRLSSKRTMMMMLSLSRSAQCVPAQSTSKSAYPCRSSAGDPRAHHPGLVRNGASLEAEMIRSKQL